MGREVRRVPKTWKHPKCDGHYVPLYGGSFAERVADWDENNTQWERGFRASWSKDGDKWIPRTGDELAMTFSDWDGERPDPADYMPDWPESERTHWQMYEDTTEGTPISPVMDSPEMLARWLVDNGASAFADQPASYEMWLTMTQRGSAPSAVMVSGGPLVSGVEAMSVIGRASVTAPSGRSP